MCMFTGMFMFMAALIATHRLVQMLMPMLAFVDRTGNIRAQHSGDDKLFEAASHEQNLRRIIESLVKPGASAMMKP